MAQSVSKKRTIGEKARSGKAPLILTAAFAAFWIVAVVLSVNLLSIPVVAVCSIAILEVALTALLRKTPVYVHIIAVALQFIIGARVGKVIFMILMCAVYIFALILLSLWRDEEN